MSRRTMTLAQAASRRVLVLDGAVGTMLGTGVNSRAEARVPRAYLDAGADIITTNSFMLNAVDLGLPVSSPRVAVLNEAAAKRARTQADRMTARNPDQARFVAGSVGPTSAQAIVGKAGKTTGPSISYDDLMRVFVIQMSGLIKGRVDAILIETAYAETNLRAALDACSEVTNKVKSLRSQSISL